MLSYRQRLLNNGLPFDSLYDPHQLWRNDCGAANWGSNYYRFWYLCHRMVQLRSDRWRELLSERVVLWAGELYKRGGY
jgi:hypothetical protein